MCGVRDRKQKEEEKADLIYAFNLWIRATLTWVLFSCHELGTKLIINTKEFQWRSGLCWHNLNGLVPGSAQTVVNPGSLEHPKIWHLSFKKQHCLYHAIPG